MDEAYWPSEFFLRRVVGAVGHHEMANASSTEATVGVRTNGPYRMEFQAGVISDKNAQI